MTERSNRTVAIGFSAYLPSAGLQVTYASKRINTPFRIVGIAFWAHVAQIANTFLEVWLSSDEDNTSGRKPTGTKIFPSSHPVSLSADDVPVAPDPLQASIYPVYIPFSLDVPEENKTLKVWGRNTHATVDQDIEVVILIEPYPLAE